MSSSVQGFSIYDLLTRVAPGTILVIPIGLIIIPVSSVETVPSSGYLIAIALILSFISGEYLNLVREALMPVPTSFRRVLYTETDEKDYLTLSDRLIMGLERIPGVPEYNPEQYSIYVNSEQTFWQSLKKELDISDGQNARDVYAIFSMYMETRMGRVTRRKLTLYQFHQNMIWSTGASILILLSGFVIPDPANPNLSLLALFLYLISLVILVQPIFRVVDQEFVDTLITQFYTVKEK